MKSWEECGIPAPVFHTCFYFFSEGRAVPDNSQPWYPIPVNLRIYCNQNVIKMTIKSSLKAFKSSALLKNQAKCTLFSLLVIGSRITMDALGWGDIFLRKAQWRKERVCVCVCAAFTWGNTVNFFFFQHLLEKEGRTFSCFSV